LYYALFEAKKNAFSQVWNLNSIDAGLKKEGERTMDAF
jgi:hypothetical protein